VFSKEVFSKVAFGLAKIQAKFKPMGLPAKKLNCSLIV
jgi:hypothetical protein